MSISSNLPPPNYSLEGGLTAWAKDSIQNGEKRAEELTNRAKALDDQAHLLQQLLDGVKVSMDAKGCVDLHEAPLSLNIERLKDEGVCIPVPPGGVLTKETIGDWVKIVGQNHDSLVERVKELLSDIPATLRKLQDMVSFIMKILEQIHEIISMILRSMVHHK